MSLIMEAVTPKAILSLWSDQNHVWAEVHLGAGFLKFAQLVEEICPDDSQEVCSGSLWSCVPSVQARCFVQAEAVHAAASTCRPSRARHMAGQTV